MNHVSRENNNSHDENKKGQDEKEYLYKKWRHNNHTMNSHSDTWREIWTIISPYLDMRYHNIKNEGNSLVGFSPNDKTAKTKVTFQQIKNTFIFWNSIAFLSSKILVLTLQSQRMLLNQPINQLIPIIKVFKIYLSLTF